jgi:hypothetical protein
VIPELQKKLAGILKASGDCLVGIPNILSATPKAKYWNRYRWATDFLVQRAYVSAFVTRPDSAPWINTDAYWKQLESLWIGQDVTLVRGGTRSLTAADLIGARSVREIVAPREHAFRQYAHIRSAIGHPPRVLLCLGPTATVLAVDLCANGMHAIDLGHVGLWLKKYRQGQPMVITAKDKAA